MPHSRLMPVVTDDRSSIGRRSDLTCRYSAVPVGSARTPK
jgi:hypothetical protein